MEDKYKRREHIALAYLSDKWQVRTNPSFVDFIKWKLIHKKHKEILEAYLLDNDVEIEFIDINKNWNKDNGFIKYYNENSIYRLKKNEEIEPETIKIPNSEIELIEPEFEIILYFVDNMGILHGNLDNDAIRWKYVKDKYLCITHSDKYNLTPYKEKKEWYEDESNFPCALMQLNCVDDTEIPMGIFVCYSIESYSVIPFDFRPATNEEIDSLKKEIK